MPSFIYLSAYKPLCVISSLKSTPKLYVSRIFVRGFFIFFEFKFAFEYKINKTMLSTHQAQQQGL